MKPLSVSHREPIASRWIKLQNVGLPVAMQALIIVWKPSVPIRFLTLMLK